jgi:hypothetical protein
VFATGWQTDDAPTRWGRPAGIVIAPDGSLIVSDDAAGYLYRICYNCACAGATMVANPASSNVILGNSVQFTAHANCGETPAFQWWVGAVQGSSVNWQKALTYTETPTFKFFVRFECRNGVHRWAAGRVYEPVRELQPGAGAHFAGNSGAVHSIRHVRRHTRVPVVGGAGPGGFGLLAGRPTVQQHRDL